MSYGLLNDYLLGQTIDAYKYFGAHKEIRDGVEGYVFRLYAPMAKDVSVIGEFNNWNPVVNKMNLIDISGTWEIFIPGVKNYQTYKFHFLNAKNNYVDKADPFAFFSDYKPGSCSRIFDYTNFIWHDLKYMQKRTRNFDKPMSIYELHVGSWKGQVDNRNLSYEEVADYLIPYVKEHGFTHVELMPIVQYPFDGSWGYQATGFFSVDSRYGNPKQLMSFVDRMHQENIGVILDFAPVHFAVDDFGLIDFDAKETTSKTSFPLTNIHPHQLIHIRRVIKHQGITFLIIKMCATYFLFPGWDLIDFVDNNTRKSIPLEYIKEKSYVIKEGFIPPLDYIKALDLLIKEKTKNDKEIY